MKMKSVHQNWPEFIAEELRETILNGYMSPGDRLKQKELAEQFEASLIPVREALRTLEMEGLVTIIPNKGAVVTELSASDVKNIFETRIILEAGALECSFQNLTEDILDKAEQMINRMDDIQDTKKLSSLNRTLHELIYSGTDNMYLLEMIESHYKKTERYMRLYLIAKKHNALSQDYHRRILQAIREKNVENAVILLKRHMTMAMNALVEELEYEKTIDSQ